MDRQETGRAGEKLARTFLERRKYRVLETNYRTRLGEIDLVCRDGDTLVFVEVKTRTSDAFGTPADSVDSRKQERLRRLVAEYVTSHELDGCEVRGDVVSVRLGAPKPDIEHIVSAF